MVEASQTLEAQILAMLSPSVEHVIQIGNLELPRVNTNCSDLSLGSVSGATDYRFDMSMMERLVSDGYPTSKLQEKQKKGTKRELEDAGDGKAQAKRPTSNVSLEPMREISR